MTTIKKESGIALVISLVMLVLLTLIAVTGMRVTGLEEKMVGNDRDKNLSFQAAEAALRDAEADIEAAIQAEFISVGAGGINFSNLDGDCATTTTAGYCYSLAPINIADDPAPLTRTVSYGSASGVDDLEKVAQQPEYLISAREVQTPGEDGPSVLFTIIAVGYGSDVNTTTILEETYKATSR